MKVIILLSLGYGVLNQRVLIKRDETTSVDVQLLPEVSNMRYHSYSQLDATFGNITKACSKKAKHYR